MLITFLSYTTFSLSCASETLAENIPSFFERTLSMFLAQDAQVIPSTLKDASSLLLFTSSGV